MTTVISTWRRKWDRLSKVSWGELQTRAGQELNKRIDLALYRANLHSPKNGIHYDSAETGTFFFSSTDLPHRTELLKKYLPNAVESIVKEADEICRHRFQLLGFHDLDYGAEIDWHLDAVHGKRAPLKPWYKIRFLDFNEVGDHKITWELNRHQHLVTLAKAWTLTGDNRYVEELLAQWYAWQKANPYPIGINWGSSLEVAFRSLSWLWAAQLLEDCPAVPKAFLPDLLHALAVNGRYIARFLSTYFSPNTHLLGEAAALFFIGTLCPQLSAAKTWRDDGWKILLEESERQIRPDGLYFEQALYYHVYALDFFLHARILAARNLITIPAVLDAVLQRMLKVVEAVSQISPPDSFGDDDGGRLFDPRRNRADHLTDPLAIARALFPHSNLGNSAPLTEEAIWLLGDEAVAQFSAKSEPASELRSKSFPHGGIYVMASGQASPQQMVIDAGPQGTGRCGHGHADAMSVRVSVAGRRWLVDRGTYCYICEDHERERFRGTRSHNTLCVDEVDQAIPAGPFAWEGIPEVSTDYWLAGETFSFFRGSHNGYQRLSDPVMHRRTIFHLHGEFWLVRDVAEGLGAHDLEINWHFAPDIRVVHRDNSSILASCSRSGEQLALVTAENSGWKAAIVPWETSPAYGQKEPAQVARFAQSGRLPAECATLILPLQTGSDKLGTFARITEQIAKPACGYRYTSGSGVHFVAFAESAKEPWKVGPCETDAKFFYCQVQGGRLMHLIMCGGSFATLQGKTLLPPQRAVERIEWVRGSKEPRVVSSGETTVHSLSEEALESDDFVF